MKRGRPAQRTRNRCVWFYERASFPHRDAPPLELEKFWANPGVVRMAGGFSWEWMVLTGNLPHIVVSDLVYHHDDQLLFAATYGRGIWRMSVKALKEGTTATTGLNEASVVK